MFSRSIYHFRRSIQHASLALGEENSRRRRRREQEIAAAESDRVVYRRRPSYRDDPVSLITDAGSAATQPLQPCASLRIGAKH